MGSLWFWLTANIFRFPSRQAPLLPFDAPSFYNAIAALVRILHYLVASPGVDPSIF